MAASSCQTQTSSSTACWVDGRSTSIFRYNSGFPVSSPVDIGGWPTNWNVRSWSVPIRDIQSSPTRGGNGQPANLFSDPVAAYNSFRSPAPGETGARNILRGMAFLPAGCGLSKSFGMPWSENHKLTIRWETFNVTNTQYLTGNADVTNGLDPQFGTPPPTFFNFTGYSGNSENHAVCAAIRFLVKRPEVLGLLQRGLGLRSQPAFSLSGFARAPIQLATATSLNLLKEDFFNDTSTTIGYCS